jgi:hypothetical protein
MTCPPSPNVFEKKNQTMRRLICPNASHCGAQKIRAYVFLPQNLFFNSLFLRKTP